MTDRLLARHAEETTELLRKLHTPDMLREHSLRQAKELLAHAYEMERKFHESWGEHRWCGKT